MSTEKRSIQDEIDRLLEVLKETPTGTDQYKWLREDLEALIKARATEVEAEAKVKASQKTRIPIDPNTIILAATNIVGILLVLNYEQLGVVSSKALGFIAKGRL